MYDYQLIAYISLQTGESILVSLGQENLLESRDLGMSVPVTLAFCSGVVFALISVKSFTKPLRDLKNI